LAALIDQLEGTYYYQISPSGNTIFHNRLLYNAENNAYYMLYDTEIYTVQGNGTNYWDFNGEGNWWSDWQPPAHPSSNGIVVDTPRPIASGTALIADGTNVDHYPLVIGYVSTMTMTVTPPTMTTAPPIPTATTSTTTLTIPPPSNRPPIADANGPYEVNGNENIKLDGTRSSDPDGDHLTYSWMIKIDPTGRASLTGSDTATPTFHAPDNVYVAVYVRVELTVDDGRGHTDSDTALVRIQPVAPYPELPFATYAGMVISTVAILTTIVVGYSVYLVRRERLLY
jgi:hypothetical protein